MDISFRNTAIALAVAAVMGSSVAGAAETGPYIGLAFGQSQAADLDAGSINASLASLGFGAATSVDNKGTPFKIFAGYQTSPHFAVEGGYTSFGKFTSRSTITSGGSGTVSGEWKGYSLNVNAVGLIPVSESFSLFGKAGLGIWNLDFNLAASGPGGSAAVSQSENGVSPILGFGAMFKVSNNFAIRADLERHFSIGDSNTTGESDIDLITIGAQYRF